ncbi:DNA-directed RNA polymerase-like protein III 25 kDa polypeptide [Dendryphion nanum]|uniref:DNA-directed RNA polymerase subunit n=1 Tax=Dendryphion nanum TaxID=256645 RepID=A0A9P9DNL1_9PLEO|nr:DNA-directed RNA polymerase-like protein III 25 kDa polypeptide [Dendryphion nanum]
MFILTTIQDLIPIKPQELKRASKHAIEDAINTKYANRVIQNVGLCIALWDIVDTTEGLIGHGDGLVNVNVEFRMVIFRPFRGEIIAARIKYATEEGITLDVNFTSEIFVPHQHLFPNSVFDRAEGVYIWKTDEGHELFFDKGEPVLFRVEAEEWIDTQPTVIQKDENGDIIEQRDTSWRVIGSMNQEGLGPSLWWGDQGGEIEEGDEEGEEA